MKRARTIWILFCLLLGAGLATSIGLSQFFTSWVPLQIKEALPVPVSWDKTRWSWPFGVRIERISIPNPPGCRGPNLLEVREARFQVPWWGIFFRPLLVEVTVKDPHLMMETANMPFLADLVLKQLSLHRKGPISSFNPAKMEEEEAPEVSAGTEAGPSRIAPLRLQILEGRMEFTDERVNPDQPVILIRSFDLTAEIVSPLTAPTIQIKSRGDLATPVGEKIGFVSVDTRFQPLVGNMEGRVQFFHERLGDLRSLYYYAPQPFYFQSGIGGPILEWRIRNGKEVQASLRCLAKNLRIDGTMEDVPWNSLLKVLEDSEGNADLTVTAEGRLDDPTFDLHDRLLSELEWAIKERAVTAGIRVPTGRIFFGLEKSASDEGEEVE